jgi:hypothetical protein
MAKKKKTVKAKQKKVKSKQKYRSQSVKKDTARKSRQSIKSKKRSHKKIKYDRKHKVSMEDLYSIINKIQLGNKEYTFYTTVDESFIVENTVKDVELRYKKDVMKTQVVFTIYPPEHKPEDVNIVEHIELMDDEIPDINQIFP